MTQGSGVGSGEWVPPVEHLEAWAATNPDGVGVRILDDEGDVAVERTYRQLAQTVRSIAVELADRMAVGSAVVLLYAPGLAFIEAFFGCLKAGMVAIPAYPPDPLRLSTTVSRLVSIMDDARPAAVLTDALIAEHLEVLFGEAPSLRSVAWICTEGLGGSVGAEVPPVALEDIALVQYSSGSTGHPKGVVLTHQNLAANIQAIHAAFALEKGKESCISWLPAYHDMGLIGTLICSVVNGGPTHLLSPVAFLRRPWVWLEAMSRYRCTISGSPSFGYELCTRKTPDSVVDSLDLSSWRVAFNGAEPIDVRTMRSFSTRFARAGFAPSAMLPCYGLAEATLLVSGKSPADVPEILTVDAEALARGAVALTSPGGAGTRELVACGRPPPGVHVRIIDPASGETLPEGRVGEIEVGGASVATRYWRRGLEGASPFRTADGVSWVRTGDLGTLVDGQVVPTGRAKDVLLVRGRNVYPQDLERSAERALPDLRRGCTVAFSVEPGADERIVVAAETTVDVGDLPALAAAMVAAVATEGVRVAVVVLARPHALPKTSSGKVRRSAVRTAWRDGTLDVVLEQGEGGAGRGRQGAAPPRRDATHLATTIREEVSRTLDRPIEEVPGDSPFADQGLDSAQLVELQARLEDLLGQEIPAGALWGQPTIDGLAAWLADAAPAEIGGDQAAPLGPGDARPSTAGAVAVIGIGVRVGVAEGPEAFWELFATGDPEGALRTSPGPASAATHGRFDARFFGMSGREAVHAEPGHRALLEVAWQAVEDAGIDPRSLAGRRVGVFVGASPSEYGVLTDRSGAPTSAYAVTGLAPAMAANRISYLLDLRGPSITVDTACSSSLVAAHLAVNSLRSGECDLALVGGVNVVLTDDIARALGMVGAMSPTGACHTFDAAADGYVRGEGCGVVVLERTGPDRASRRRRYAEILGSATNQDGRSNGLTAPNPDAQSQVVRAALTAAGCEPDDVVAVEAHGTGTPLGDPIECSALRSVFGDREEPVVLTSVKAVVGHLEAAAGILGLIRTALCASRGVIPAQAGFSSLNERIDLGASLVVPTVGRPWATGLCGVSSFGFGGTNAHVVTGRAVTGTPTPETTDPGVLPVSAASPGALCRRGRQISRLLETAPASAARLRLAAIAGNHRYRAVLTGDATEMREQAVELADSSDLTPAPRCDRLVVAFGGQGASPATWHDDLLGDGPIGAGLRRIEDAVGPIEGRSLRQWLTRPGLLSTAVAQPLFTAVSLVLYRAAEEAGLAPEVILGHSLGEVAAMAAAGAIDDLDAVRFAIRRGEAMRDDMPVGSMVNLLAGVEEVSALIDEGGHQVVVAAENGPTSTVVAGAPAAVAELGRAAEAAGVRSIVLPVDRAFHSPDVERCYAALDAAEIPFRPTSRSIVTTTDGILRPPGWRPAPDHWIEHGRRRVRFDSAMATAVAGTRSFVLEIGASQMLGRVRRRCPDERWHALVAERRDGPLLGALLGRLYLDGHDVPWDLVVDGAVPDIAVPPYPFGGETHWVTSGSPTPAPSRPTAPPGERRSLPADPGLMPRPCDDGAAASLRLALAGLGIGPGSRLTIRGLAPPARERVASVGLTLGADVVDGVGNGPAIGSDLVVTSVDTGPLPEDGRSLLVDATARPAGPMDVLRGRAAAGPRIGIAFTARHGTGPRDLPSRDIVEGARIADGLGVDTVWVVGHPTSDVLPAAAVWSAALATGTTHARLGVAGIPVPSGLSERMAEEWALVDVLSGGRIDLALVPHPPDDAPMFDAALDWLRSRWLDREASASRPLWLGVGADLDGWQRAARLGLNVLVQVTSSAVGLGEVAATYQQDRLSSGHGPGEITVLVPAATSPASEVCDRLGSEGASEVAFIVETDRGGDHVSAAAAAIGELCDGGDRRWADALGRHPEAGVGV